MSCSCDEIATIFAQVLTILGNEGLIGREMFAIDGVKLPSNASKHRSGTRAEFMDRAAKLERAAQTMLDRHRSHDADSRDEVGSVKTTARLERMTREAAQISAWLTDNPNDRLGTRGSTIKSNLTDNESAKMATDKGVIQGYCGVAVVDEKHQVIVEASAHGTGNEQALLLPVIDACAEQRTSTTLITADAGYHSEANLAALAARNIDALIADNQMRSRDERLADQDKHTSRPDPLQDKSKPISRSTFRPDDFKIAEDQSHAICPAGHKLARSGEGRNGDYTEVRYRAAIEACAGCALRAQCLRNIHTRRPRVIAVQTRTEPAVHTPLMRARIDSDEGRARYGQRFATVEPVFGNLRHNKRLYRFTLRGQRKVDGQWKLFAQVPQLAP